MFNRIFKLYIHKGFNIDYYKGFNIDYYKGFNIDYHKGFNIDRLLQILRQKKVFFTVNLLKLFNL